MPERQSVTNSVPPARMGHRFFSGSDVEAALRPAGKCPAEAGRHNEARTARWVWQVLGAALVLLGWALPGYGWGGKIKLVRKYRPGEKTVYQTKIQTRATIRSNPPGLEKFLPPMPTELSARQENTVTVRALHSDGSADLENRFDRFEFQSDLPDRLPESLREPTRQAQEEFGRRISGHALAVHYDRQGRLLGFEGADEILEQLDAPLREPVRQILRLFLEQTGAGVLYPDHRVRPGEEWTQKLAAQPSDAYPFAVEGESTLHYTGKTKYRGVKAAIVDFRFSNILRPELESLRRAGPLAQLEATGMGLDIRIEGQGQGRALLALDNGRVLQNHATIQQVLTARLRPLSSGTIPAAEPPALEVRTETSLEVEGSGKWVGNLE